MSKSVIVLGLLEAVDNARKLSPDDSTGATIEALAAKQWDTAADVTEMSLRSVRSGLSTGEEELQFLVTEFRKMSRPS